MVAPTAEPTLREKGSGEVPTLRWWGLDLMELHDRLWASRGVQVVRPGSSVAGHGPSMYLLVGRDEMIVFDPEAVRRTLAWLRPRALRLRVVDQEEEQYRETIVADGQGRFVRVEREYRARTRATTRCYLTAESEVAKMWRSWAKVREARESLRREIGRATTAPASIRGRIFGGGAEGREQELVALLMESFARVGAVLEGVYEYSPGVWLHETVTPGHGVRLIGPLWIGAGVDLAPGTTMVGPRAIPDAADAGVVVDAVEWERINLPNWPMRMPTLRGRRLRRVSKRLFDMGFSAGVLLATAPLYPVVIAAISIEDGWPPFFAHRRQSLSGREFPCLKFRTMRKDAEKIKAELQGKNQADGPQFFIREDPRLLRIGRMLRRFQIDELPQFVNVLLGHMSVVGPRPSPDNENQFCPAWREARLSVRPGVTGLWQIRRTRAPETDFQEWIRYDLEYVQHESWMMDLWIIAQTVKSVFFG